MKKNCFATLLSVKIVFPFSKKLTYLEINFFESVNTDELDVMDCDEALQSDMR